MARMIDGNWKDFLLNLSVQALMDFQENRASLSTLRTAVEEQPTLTQPNEPLSLEVFTISQLLQMLGEKVEVIRMGKMCQAEWATVRSFGDCKTDSGCSCCHELYGKTWLAYRRPPEGKT